jgi:hypothetical protein
MRYLGCLALFLCSLTAGAQPIVRAKIFDAETKEPLPFVNISVIRKPSGTTTGIDGGFTLKIDPYDSLLISYVGYEPQKVGGQTNPFEFFLKRKPHELREIEVFAGENPALDIVRRTIANVSKNDPENLPSFKYNAYHKLFATAEGSFDTIQKKSAVVNFFEKHYLFLNETYSERTFVRSRHDNETIVGNRMSGVKDPFFAALGNQFQSFSFYKPHINLLDQVYVNPLSPGTFSRYDFVVEETRINQHDTSYIISFSPLPGKTFNGLKGVLTINSNFYAVENVKTQPADDGAMVVIRIQQKYSFNDGHWFPQELHSEFVLTEQKVSEHPIKYVHQTYISEISINKHDQPVARSNLNLEFAADANKKNELFWNEVRTDSLSIREQNTYRLYDSMPIRTLGILNAFVKVAEAVATSKIKVGKFYIPTQSLIRNNGYEGLRLGIGLQTGETISKFIVADGFAAFGTKDESLKYGASLQFMLSAIREAYFKFSFHRDLLEPGNSDFLKPPPPIASSQMIRNWLTTKMDSINRIKIQFNFRPVRYSEASFFLQHTQHQPAYLYSYQKNSETALTGFTLAEAGCQFKFVAGEQFSQIRNTKITTGFTYPLFDFAVSRSVQNIFNGDFTFTKVELKFDYQLHWRGSAKTIVQLAGGFLSGDAPYSSLFNGKGSNSGRFDLNSFVVPNYFQTMKIYEFTSDRYAYLFFTHDFGRIVSTRSKYFRPELAVKHNVGFGTLANPERHSLTLQTMRNGFYESGMVLTNLLRFNYVNLGYIGLGGGVFYRYGSYALPDAAKNVVAKINVSFAL